MPRNIICALALIAATFCLSNNAMHAQLREVTPQELAKIKEALPEKAPAKPKKPRKVLLFSKTAGFRHSSISVGVKSLTMLGNKTGAFTAVHTEDESVFEPDRLKEFDMVIMVNTTGEIFKSKGAGDAEREARLKKSLVDFVKGGKGIGGTHSATDTYKKWKAYNDMMGGAFVSHPWHMDVPIRILDANHPLTKVFGGQGFTIKDEIYQFRDDTAQPTDRRMLLSLKSTWDGTKKGNRKDNFYPISWIGKYGNGRTFYCSLGHREEIYWNPMVLEHYLAGFQYAMGDLAADATPIEIPEAE